MTIQMKSIGQYVPVVLFIMLHKVVLTFEFIDEILKFLKWTFKWKLLSSALRWCYYAWFCGWNLKRDHWIENYLAVLSRGPDCAVRGS